MPIPAASESALHARIARLLGGPPASRVLVGVGDDAAVLVPRPGKPVFCSDACVEDVHFRLNKFSFADLAWKSIGPCLSDVAAMGAEPAAVVISIALPSKRVDAEAFVDAFYGEASALSDAWKFDVVGGDLASSPGPLMIDVAALGYADKPVRRTGAKPGDWIAVSGPLGGAAAGLHALERGQGDEASFARLTIKQKRPRPRLDAVSDLAFANAAIDVSDGLALDLRRLCEASGVGAALREGEIPILADARAYALAISQESAALAWALEGGEDYELLACFSPESWASAERARPGFSARWIRIGSIENGADLCLESTDGRRGALAARGFDHFSGAR